MSDDEEITITVNGTKYGGWKSATVVSSLDSMCGTFDLGVFDRWGEQETPVEIRPGDECQVLAGDEPVLSGYVDSVSPGITPNDHSIVITGRDKTCDLVDCSAEVDSFEVLGIGLDELARMICSKFGISVRVETDVGDPFIRFAVQPGETAFNCLERASRQRGVLLTTNGDGELVLSARGVFNDTGDAIVEGKNLKVGSAVYDFRDRFSDYKVHGQSPAFYDGAENPFHNQNGEARDVNVMRYRPLIMTAEYWATCDSCRIRAENECTNRAGKSSRVNAQLVGWRQSDGRLWKPGQVVSITSPCLYLDNAEFVTCTVRFSFSDSSGRITELELKRPDAYLDHCTGEVEKDPFEL